MRFGPAGGARNASVVKVAVHVGDAAPDTLVHVAAAPSAALPFMNCTVPVGLAPVPDPETVAVSVMLPPDAILVDELVTAVVVASPAAVSVNATAVELLTVKLGSPLYCAVMEWLPAAKVEIPPAVNASAAWLMTTLVAAAIGEPLSENVTVPVGVSGLLFAIVIGLTVA